MPIQFVILIDCITYNHLEHQKGVTCDRQFYFVLVATLFLIFFLVNTHEEVFNIHHDPQQPVELLVPGAAQVRHMRTERMVARPAGV